MLIYITLLSLLSLMVSYIFHCLVLFTFLCFQYDIHLVIIPLDGFASLAFLSFAFCLHLKLVCIFSITFQLLALSIFCYMFSSYHNVSTQYVHTICPHNMSTQYVHTICPHNMSTQCVHITCPHNLSTQLVHTTCPHNVSTQRVHTCPHNVSTQRVHTTCPHNVSSQCVLTMCPHNVCSI